MVKDAKGYRSKRNEKPRSRGWFILLVSHMAILAVGISLGHWMGGRFASGPSAQKTVSQEVESTRDKVSQPMDKEEERGGSETIAKDEIGKGVLRRQDRPEEQPQFTFYEFLQKEETGSGEISTEDRQPEKTASAKETSAGSPDIKNGPKQVIGKSASQVYYVQLASFREEERARKLIEHLRGRGHPAELISKVIPNKGIWYRVRMGPYGSKTEARDKAVAIEKTEKLQPFVVPERREKDS